MPSVDDPETWVEYAKLDGELEKILRTHPRPQFEKGDDVSSLITTREEWQPRYELFAANIQNANPDVRREEISIPRRDGGFNRALVYERKETSHSGRPVVVFYHGGGFCLGGPEMDALHCTNFVKAYDCIAIAASYRLAPENKFPIGVQDSWDSLKWIAANASRLGADPSKGFIVGGTSAGANIASVLSHLARDEKLSPPLTGVSLIVPALAGSSRSVPEEFLPYYKSHEQNKETPVLNEKANEIYIKAYAPDPEDPFFSPLSWPRGHADLPPTHFQICGLDPLRDDGLIYERLLRTKHGISTKLDIYPGLPHVFWANWPLHSSTKKFANNTKDGIGWLLGRGTNEATTSQVS